jgi:Galactose-3-O-sulfotransferase
MVSLAARPAIAQGDQAVIFLHLPKCGGTTLNRIIEWEYNPLRIFSVDPIFFLWSFQKLNRWPRERLAGIRVFKGHMPFGIHRKLPQPSTYITFLRHPIDRVISAYYFARNYKLHPKHHIVRRMTMDEYVRSWPNHNVQTKYLSGRPFTGDWHAGECNEEMLELAKENLATHFSLVGLTERFDEGLALLKIIFGWNIAQYAKFNVTRSRPRKNTLSSSTLELIAERNRYDVALYDHVVPMFEERFESFGEEAEIELARIREAKALGKLQTVCYFAASGARKAISRIHSAL